MRDSASLVEIVLHPVTGDVGLHLAGPHDFIRAAVLIIGPIKSDRQPAHVIRITNSSQPWGGGGYKTAIKRSAFACGVVIIGKTRLEVIVGVQDLAPVVKPDGFHFLQNDLGSSQVLPGDLNDCEPGGKSPVKRNRHDREDEHSDDDFDQGIGRARVFVFDLVELHKPRKPKLSYFTLVVLP
jgi:hypothetical protein